MYVINFIISVGLINRNIPSIRKSIEETIEDLSFLIIILFILTPLYHYMIKWCFFQVLFIFLFLFIIVFGSECMFNLNYIEQVEKNELLFILNNNGVVPYVDGDKLIILNSSFEMSICDFSINHLNSILGTSIVDSKYVYYFISIAYDNAYFNDDVKRKKKSL